MSSVYEQMAAAIEGKKFIYAAMNHAQAASLQLDEGHNMLNSVGMEQGITNANTMVIAINGDFVELIGKMEQAISHIDEWLSRQ